MLGREVEIVAVPSRLFGPSGDEADTHAFLSLDETPLLTDFADAIIRIEPLDPIRVKEFYARAPLNGQEDWSNAIRFALRMNKSIVSRFIDLTYSKYPAASDEGKLIRDPRNKETRGIVFHGLLYRRFRDLFTLCLMVANLADYHSFPIIRGFSTSFGRAGAWDNLSASWARRPSLPDLVGLKKLSAGSLLRFLRAEATQLEGSPTDPLIRALTNHSYVYSASGRSPLMQLFWSLAAIEALLNPGGRSVRAQMEDRLKVLFEGPLQDEVLSNFRKVYDYRSKMSHGALNLPMVLNDASMFADYPVDQAEFASALSARLMQMCFERQQYRLSFRLQLC